MFKGTIKKKGKGGGSMVCAIKRVRKFQLKERKKKALFREVRWKGKLRKIDGGIYSS